MRETSQNRAGGGFERKFGFPGPQTIECRHQPAETQVPKLPPDGLRSTGDDGMHLIPGLRPCLNRGSALQPQEPEDLDATILCLRYARHDLRERGVRRRLGAPNAAVHFKSAAYPGAVVGNERVPNRRPTRSITAATCASLCVSTPATTARSTPRGSSCMTPPATISATADEEDRTVTSDGPRTCSN